MRTMVIGLVAVLAASTAAAAEPFVMSETGLAAVSAGLEPSSEVFARITSTTVTSVDGVVTRRTRTATLTGPGTIVLEDGTRFTVEDLGKTLDLGDLAPGLVDVIGDGTAVRTARGTVTLGDGTEIGFDDLRDVLDIHGPALGLGGPGNVTVTFLPLLDLIAIPSLE